MNIKKITALVSAIAVSSTMLIQMPLVRAAASTLEVGTNKTYNTIHEAVEAAKALNPQSEADRVTINVDPGNYEEQVRIDNAKYITIQQTPNTNGKVNLSWYFCTGYCTSNTDLTGLYDPTIDWSLDETWNGYKDGDEKFTKYEIGQRLDGISTISYYDINGVAHKNVPVNSQLGNLGGLGWSYDKMAPLIVTRSSSDITVKDLNVVNSVPVMKIAAELDGHLTPEVNDKGEIPLFDHSALSICSEDTPMVKPTADIYDSDNHVDRNKYKKLADSGHVFSPGESAWLLRSSIFNERGHALASLGDRVIFENVRARGNQDSIWVSDGRAYFKNCTLIGGTDYIYGGANAVFDNCKLGFAGFTDYPYGNPLTTPNTDAKSKYGYLFFNCTIYNESSNGGESNFGGSWGGDGQATFYNTTIDDNGTVGNSNVQIAAKGWGRFGAEDGLSRLYEYGTKNTSGKAVDLSKRIVNKSVEEGGPGMGTVLDKWQILEFNPRNYFSADCDPKYKEKGDWDPMNFGAVLADVDSQIAAATINVPAGEATEVSLPVPTDNNIEFHWASASANAIVSDDETKMTVTRPALGEEPIVTSVILYARDKTTGYGDKKEIPVTINATTDTENVFSIPVSIEQSATGANTYTVTLTKNGALIKSQEIELPKGETTATDIIADIPASTNGIDYDVTIVSTNNDFTVTSPKEGKTTIKGITGENAELNIVSTKLVDNTIDVKISTSASDGNKTYDLISLAKQNGADSSIASSDIISVEMDVTVNERPTSAGYIDISSGAPSNSNSAVPQRFTVFKLNNSWQQIDAVDNSQGFSGVTVDTHQRLNITGCWGSNYPNTNHIKATINYKEKTVTIDGNNNGGSGQTETPCTLGGFPEDAVKGKFNMGVFVGSGSDDYTISNVKVTYKKIVTDKEPDVEKFEKTINVTADGVGVGSNNNGTYSISGTGAYYLDINAIADDKYFADSSYVTVKYDAQTDMAADSAIDITASTPETKYTQNSTSRIERTKLNKNWGQIDVYSGNTTSHYKTDESFTDTANLILNIDNKGIANNGTATVSFKIDKDTESVLATGAAKSLELTDCSLPSDFSNLYLAVYPNGSTLTISNVSVTYETAREIVPTSAPTSAPTGTPTGNPTSAPTGTPTTPPSPSTGRITGAIITNGGKTKVTLEGITSGVVVAAKYDNGKMTAVKTVNITEDTPNPLIIDDIEANKIMVWKSLDSMEPLCEAKRVSRGSAGETPKPLEDTVVVDFTSMSAVPEYSAESGQGFVTKSSAIMPLGHERQVAAASAITVSSEGAKITETTGSYLHKKNNSNDGDDYNNGGLIYRIDTGKPGAYHLEVEVTGTSADTIVAPTGMNGGNLTGTSNWDNCEQVKRTVSAKWNENVWEYDFATGEDFIEIEIEPKSLASASDSKTVGVKKITVTPLENNSAGDKPTIHILGDSTQKSYSFNETISAWGQTLKNYFDLDKVNVINYSMGGRAMKSNYCEGRFDEILIRGKEGDFVFIHSAHNDETVSTNRFSRGAGTKADDLTVNNENYNKWLNMYVEAIKARGMTPVLVTAMPRVNGSTGKYSESSAKPNGFNPDSPANMRAKAAADPEVGLAELYAGAKAYIDKLDGKEVSYIYNNIEAGETPAANAANGAKGDGTHYKEAAAKQWSRIILQSIYDQSVASTDTYTDKDIMTELVSLMPQKVKTAAQSGDWSEVFPEMASDVGAVDVVPGATKQEENNFYYRNNIEKALQLGLLHKDSQNLFKPTATITVGEFARGIEKAFGLEENSLTSYTKTYAQLSSESEPVSVQSASAAEVSENGEISLYADGDGEFTVTVNQSTGGTVTVYNNSAFNTATVDIPAGVTASAVIADNNYLTLTAPEAIASGTDNNGALADGISANYVEFRNTNPEKKFTYTAKADGIITVYARYNGDKFIELVNKADSSDIQSKYIGDGDKVSGTIYGTVHFNVRAGKTYELYARGGTGRLFGVKYESTDYPQSTSALSVNSGDEIRVVATPADNHVNGSILVNGEAKTTSKEYTFTVEGDTNVSATFISEPALVEVTKIASDAALTREAMGAILYDAYQAFSENGSDSAKEYMAKYMSNNGGVPSPSDPNYDPNIQYEGSPYIPTVGWGALTDTNDLTDSLYMKVKNAYNLGLMRSEQGIGRGEIKLGTALEPQAEVTRAKAAKALVFAFTLTQKQSDESQIIPEGFAMATPAEIALPNTNAQTTVFGE